MITMPPTITTAAATNALIAMRIFLLRKQFLARWTAPSGAGVSLGAVLIDKAAASLGMAVKKAAEGSRIKETVA
jgi:hypothetical protein